MDMGRAKGMPALGVEQLADDAGRRNRISGGQDAAERKDTVRIGRELAPQVHVRLALVFILIKTTRRGVPDVDLGAGDGSTGGVDHPSRHEERVAFGLGSNARLPVGDRGRMHAPDWTEQRSRRLALEIGRAWGGERVCRYRWKLVG